MAMMWQKIKTIDLGFTNVSAIEMNKTNIVIHSWLKLNIFHV